MLFQNRAKQQILPKGLAWSKAKMLVSEESGADVKTDTQTKACSKKVITNVTRRFCYVSLNVHTCVNVHMFGCEIQRITLWAVFLLYMGSRDQTQFVRLVSQASLHLVGPGQRILMMLTKPINREITVFSANSGWDWISICKSIKYLTSNANK